MAKISFFGVDGEERSYTLHPQLTLRVGRDPGNDVVLRDPKVSRRHVEIIFERGFFVLHDLQSANGSYVNGIRVNVAPLIHGAEIKLGSSHARFVDEPAEPAHRDTKPASEPAPPPRRQTAEIPSDQLQGTVPHDKLKQRPGPTAPVRATDPADERLRDETSMIEEGDDTPIPDEKREAVAPDGISGNRFEIASGTAWGEIGTARETTSGRCFYYRRIFNVVAIVAAIVAGLVLLAGSVVAAFLAVEQHPLLASVAAALTIGFACGILLLVPKRHVRIFGDEALSQLMLAISEESIFGLPIVTFSVRLADGSTVGYLTKNALVGIVRRRWVLRDAQRRPVAHAAELGVLRPLLRKFAGDLFGLLTTDYALQLPAGARCGTYRRRQPSGAARRLELHPGAPDPRLALAFALLVDSLEKTR